MRIWRKKKNGYDDNILLFIVFVIPGVYLLIKSAVKNGILEAEKELKEIRKNNRNSS